MRPYFDTVMIKSYHHHLSLVSQQKKASFGYCNDLIWCPDVNFLLVAQETIRTHNKHEHDLDVVQYFKESDRMGECTSINSKTLKKIHVGVLIVTTFNSKGIHIRTMPIKRCPEGHFPMGVLTHTGIQIHIY